MGFNPEASFMKLTNHFSEDSSIYSNLNKTTVNSMAKPFHNRSQSQAAGSSTLFNFSNDKESNFL